jgi:hypothetical protein
VSYPLADLKIRNALPFPVLNLVTAAGGSSREAAPIR